MLTQLVNGDWSMRLPLLLSRSILFALSALCVAPASPALAGQARDVVAAAKEQLGVTLLYDPSYQRLAYPNGDVPADRGVCTDVLVRAFRRIGIDLQELVHRDMKAAWGTYSRRADWGLKRPDPNIDHRRVPNLATFFTRHGQVLPVSRNPNDYKAGDIVTWTVPPGVPHIGLVTDVLAPSGVPLIIHNIGSGTRMEDRLFAYPITGHYRYPQAR
jgi:uncharacterized protein YijF (DUF1287 family)